MLQPFIEQATGGHDLSAQQMEVAIASMLSGEASEEAMRQLLLALRQKGESVSELVGAAKALRSAMTAIKTVRSNLLDTCGTGGDGAKTFNISTAAAIVAAAAGASVAKHGNRKITSATGSADVLSELGIRVDASRETVSRCLDTLGICFCFAPMLHPAMRHVATVRRSLGVPTLFNYLGPLCNPAGAEFQVIGVGKDGLHAKLAAAVSQLPIRAALVVRGLDGMDEISLSSETKVFLVRNGNTELKTWSPLDFGLSTIDASDLYAENPKESASIIRSILDGRHGAPRDIVLANAAAGIWLTGLEVELKQAVERCAYAIDSGTAKKTLADLAAMSHTETP
jgi:anthranilate phosphoribosyltransferase